MSKRLLYLLLGLVVLGSITLAYSQEAQLQGAFAFTSSSSILHVSSSATTSTSNIYWNETEVDTLGKWTLKADKNLTINGFGLHIGTPSSVGGADNFVPNFFKNCTATVEESGKTLVSYYTTGCLNAYKDIPMEAGKTYTLTVTATPLSTAYDNFIDKSYDDQQVSLAFVALTQADGTKTQYNSITFPSLVEQQASNSVTDSSGTYTIEYTLGAYSLKNNVYKTNASSTPAITATDMSQVTQGQTYYTKSSTNSLTAGTSATVTDALKNISVKISSTSAVTHALTIKISADSSSMEITNGTSTKTCTASSTGSFNCQIP